MKKIVALFLLVLVSVAGFSSCSFGILSGEKKVIDESGFKSVTTKYALFEMIKSKTKSYGNQYLESAVADSAAAAPETSNKTVSKTNTQVDNVDEGDIVKVDENYIYKLSYDGFKIISIDDGKMTLVHETALESYYPSEMYVQENKLIVIGHHYQHSSYRNAISPGIMDCMVYYDSTSDFRVYDITDRSNPILERHVEVKGNYDGSRIVDGKLLYFTNKYIYTYGIENIDDFHLPMIKDSVSTKDQFVEVDVSKIRFVEESSYYNYFVLGSIDLSTSSHNYQVYLGYGGQKYVSEENIYFTMYKYSNDYYRTDTIIVKLSNLTLDPVGKALVHGYINDRYWMDEYNGDLRVISVVDSYVDNVWSRSTSLTIFNSIMEMRSQVTGISPGESVYSVRFNKDTGTLVTFLQVDPYFKLDLSDPDNPIVSKGLKEDGVSYYIHYLEGTPYTIGVGLDSSLVNGNVRWAGIKVTLYDNSGEEAVAVKTIVIGNAYSYAELLWNPRSLLYVQSENIFAFTAESWTYSESYYMNMSAQGLYVFGFENGNLEQRALLTNNKTIDYSNNSENFYRYYYSAINRGVLVGDYIYTLSHDYVTSYNHKQGFELVSVLDFTKHK